MRKYGILTQTVFLFIILAGIFGIIHDQITYTISPEYFTKFKYLQFGFPPVNSGGDRLTVAIIGFLATWWMGLIMGVLVGVSGLIFKDHITMKKRIAACLKIILITTIFSSICGYAYGNLVLAKKGVDWWIPETVIYKNRFISVGSIHNFSYAGGLLGTILGLIYMFFKRKTPNKN